MKKIRKTMSIVSAAAILAPIAAMPVSAAGINAYSVSYETLTSAITTDDGSTVPAGAVAVTMSIDNNTGFNANTLTLDIDEGYSVLTNTDGKPIVDKGAVLANAMTSAAISDDETTLCVVSASAMTSNADGALFTVYFTADTATATTAFVSIDDTDAEIATGEITAEPCVLVQDYYYAGDTDNDDLVNAIDASNIMTACYYHGNSFNLMTSSLSYVRDYFPSVKHMDALDVTDNKVCDNLDATEILDYSALVGAGKSDEYEGIAGRKIYFMTEA